MATQERLAQVFIGLADTLVAEFDVVDFMTVLTEVSVELLAVDAAGLMLTDLRGDLQVIASSNDQVHLLELFELQQNQGPCLECYSSGDPVTNVTLPDDRWPLMSEAAGTAGFRICHAFPLRLRDAVIGAINLFGADGTPLADSDLALGRALSDMATIGLLQERAVREQVSLVEELQGALNSRVLIEQAKGALSERTGMGMAEAFHAIRAHARRNNQSLNEVAQAVIVGTIDVTPSERHDIFSRRHGV